LSDTLRVPFLRRRSTRALGIGLAVLVIAAGAGAFFITRGAHEVTVDEAVDDFRSAPKVELAEASTAPHATAAAAPDRAAAKQPATAATSGSSSTTAKTDPKGNAFAPPGEGVYVFKTDGYEETDALAGQRHDYPDESTNTIKRDGCGWTSRWQPLSERWEENELCETSVGTKMKRYTMYHEFFGRGQREEFACDGYVQKLGSKPGDTWSFDCTSKGSKATSKVTVIGPETLTIEGRPVKATHIRYDITASGDNRGTLVQDRWLGDAPRSLLRLTQKADLQVASPFGPVGYKEAFRIDLKSLEPRR
jgi:hypothetical protein